MTEPVRLNEELLDWARCAHYVSSVVDDGDLQLRSQAGVPTRYYIRRRGRDRFELTQADDADTVERPVLFVADLEVVQRHLVAVLADNIRDDLGMEFLDLPWDIADLAPDYELSEMVRGYRTLLRTGHGPVAAAPDPVLSRLALVPLSHFLRWSIADLQEAFLDPGGAPLLRGGRYTL